MISTAARFVFVPLLLAVPLLGALVGADLGSGTAQATYYTPTADPYAPTDPFPEGPAFPPSTDRGCREIMVMQLVFVGFIDGEAQYEIEWEWEWTCP